MKIINYCWLFFFTLMIPAGLTVMINKVISLSVQDNITDQVTKLPDFSVVLVLGSGTTSDPVSRNFSFSSRMDKTAELVRSGKINKVIASGRSDRPYYNEPNDMKNALVSMGVMAHTVYPDHGGLHTFLSVKRSLKYSKGEPVIIISQRKQLERALYIAHWLGIKATGLEAAPLPWERYWREEWREMMARIKCMCECILG